MTGPAGTSVLRRSFGLPIALSLALHGLAVAALGIFPFSTKVTPVQNEGIEVDLVAVQPAPLVRSQPVLSKPIVKRTPAPAASPASVFAQAATFAVPEMTEPMVALITDAGEVSFSRPLPGVSNGQARLLRDSTPEAGSVRSKVRSGNNPRPEYPRTAREAGWEGTVVLQILVLPDGTAGNVTLHKTSGYSILDEAALSAVRRWRFFPAMDGNFPIQSVARLPVRFDLKAAN